MAELPRTIVARTRDQARAILASFGLTNPRLFGSVARGEDTETSDIDVLVDAGPHTGLLDLAGAHEALNRLFGIDLDLVTSRQVPPESRRRVFAEAVAL